MSWWESAFFFMWLRRPSAKGTWSFQSTHMHGRCLWIAAARWGGEFKTTQSAAQDLAKTAQSRGLKVELKTMDEAAIQLVSGGPW